MLDLIILFLFCVILITLYRSLNRTLSYWKRNNIWGPKPIPILGTSYSYFVRTMPEVELQWYKKYGKLFGLYNGYEPVLSVAEPELVKQILVKDFNSFRNRSKPFVNIHPMILKTMFFARDEEWKRVRAISTPAFTSGKMKKMYPLIKYSCDEFMTTLDEYAKNNSEIEIKLLHGAYTMDVIAKCAFAANTNAHKDPDNEFTKNGFSFFNVQYWKVLLSLMLPSFIIGNETFLKLLNTAHDSVDFFEQMGRRLIKQRKIGAEKHRDFLQLLLDVERNDEVFAQTDNTAMNHVNEGTDELKANTKAFSNVSEKKLTENEILGQCVIFFLAGFETTAATLSNCSYELALHIEVQQKLYEEIMAAFGSEGDVDYETLLKLPYLDAVISETLRKYPPVMRLERQAMNDVVLGDTGFTIPKGMVTEIPVYGIHYDPEYYENPFSFNPERFMPENRINIKPYTYLPFGTGPRNCIGMRFALLESKLALVNIIRRFIFFTTAKTAIPIKFVKGRRGVLTSNQLILGIKRRF